MQHIQTTTQAEALISFSYRYNASSYENDIALVQLEKLPFKQTCLEDNPAVSAVCVPWTKHLFNPNHTCSISGWGRTAGLFVTVQGKFTVMFLFKTSKKRLLKIEMKKKIASINGKLYIMGHQLAKNCVKWFLSGHEPDKHTTNDTNA